MISAEMAPFAKVGGLADVVGSLSSALAARGHDVRVVLPLYGDLDREREKIRPLKKLPAVGSRVGQRMFDFRVHLRGSASSAVKVYLLEAEELYGRSGIYLDPAGRPHADSLQRAVLHGQAALMLPALLDWPVDIVHGHDAEAVPALLYRRHWYAGRELPGPGATVLSIHNLAHQEVHEPGAIEVLGLPRSMAAYPGLLEFHGELNLMKAGLLAADRINTVSPGYARETLDDPEYGLGLEGVLAGRGDAYEGILNGADYETWNPRRDPDLPANFGPDDLAGKTACRSALLEELGLECAADGPVCGFVGRLVHQKGLDLVLPLLDRLAGDGFAFAFLGTGDPRLHKELTAAARRHPDRISFTGEFSEALAHRIYAGSDVFLMPSRFEPCGLSQLYAMRYGTPPVVRSTGGLADTVIDAGRPAGTGFVFEQATSAELMAALRRAEETLGDRHVWRKLQERGMAAEFGWESAAAAYEKMYTAALGSGAPAAQKVD